MNFHKIETKSVSQESEKTENWHLFIWIHLNLGEMRCRVRLFYFFHVKYGLSDKNESKSLKIADQDDLVKSGSAPLPASLSHRTEVLKLYSCECILLHASSQAYSR